MRSAVIASVDSLRAVAEPAGQRAKARLAEVHAALGEDMDVVQARLVQLSLEGLSPANDSAGHLLRAGGERVRALTVMLSAACFGVPPPAARELAVVAELVHLATLLHDDVIDDGEERRGLVPSRRIWGNAVSVLAGDLLLTHALEQTSATAPHAVLVDLLATLRRLVDGEVLQLRGRKDLDVREETYLRVVRDKTGSLFEWAARSGAACAGASTEAAGALGVFGAHVGLAIQLVDDVLDYAADPIATGHGLLVDLVEGKLTLPLIRALAAGAVLVSDVEAVRSGDGGAAVRVAQAVRRCGVCVGVRTLAEEETSLALRALGTLALSPAREMLARIARELMTRSS